MLAHYRPSRWYDEHPRLAFALALLYLAPHEVRRQVIAELGYTLRRHFGEQFGTASRRPLPHPPAQRWYDIPGEPLSAVEMLRQSPESVKAQSAERILAHLGKDSLALTA